MGVCFESSLLKDGYTRVSNSYLRELLNAKEEYENLRKSYEELERELKASQHTCHQLFNDLCENNLQIIEEIEKLEEENTRLIEENERLKKENELALHIEEEIPFSDYADQEYINFLESEEGLAYIKAMDSQYGYLN